MRNLDVRTYRSSDDAAMLALHNRAFGHRWSEEQWRWRFHDSPAGETQLVGAFDSSGRCLALHGGASLRILLNSEDTCGISHSDVAVDPDLRRGLGGTRLAIEVVKKFISSYCVGKSSVIWGFPEPGLRRFLTRFVHVEVLYDLVFLILELRDVAPLSGVDGSDGVEIVEVDRYDADTDELWATCRGAFGAAIVRDRTYLNWRFADRPDVDYTLFEARERRSGSLRGICVVRDGGWYETGLTLSEWLVPAEDREVETALVRRTVADAVRKRRRGLVAWFPTRSIQFHRFQIDHGFVAHPSPYQEVFMSWADGVDRGWLYDNWYQTMGDVDFF